MAYNPFGTIEAEDRTEVLFPGVPSLNNIQTHPPSTFEMTPMQINPVTGDSYISTPGDRLNPSDHRQWGNFTTNRATNMQPRGLLQHYVGEPSGPSAPMLHLPPHHQSQINAAQVQPIYPHLRSAEGTNVYCTEQDSMVSTENSGNTSCTHYNQLDQVNSEEIVRVYSHSERYKNKVEQAKNELKNYFNDLHQKLNDHHDNLIQQLDSRYEQNVSVIEDKQKEIKNLDVLESSITRNEGNTRSRTSEDLKKYMTKQKQELERDVIPLTQVEIRYKPELLGDLREIVTLVTGPTEDCVHPLTSETNDTSPQQTREVQTNSEIRTDPESPRVSRLTHQTMPLPRGPIIHNVSLNDGISNLQDPTGLVVDRKNNDVIYVADKDKHRVQVFDRSGNYLSTIVHGKEMRYPHSVAVSERYLFALCAANSHEYQYVLRLQKETGKDIRKLPLKDIRHIPLCINEESLYIATYNHMVEVFDMDLAQKGKINVKLERRTTVRSLFTSGAEIRDICIRNSMLYLLVINSNHAIQKFSLDGDLMCLLAPVGDVNDPRYFTVDNRGAVFVTEGSEGRVKLFKTNGKFEMFAYAEMEGKSEKITNPMGIDVDSKGSVVLCCTQENWVLKEL